MSLVNAVLIVRYPVFLAYAMLRVDSPGES